MATTTALGHQRPRIEHRPAEIASSQGTAVSVAAQIAGLILDEWQEYFLSLATARRSDGYWSASEVGLECARQNGKSGLIEARIIWGLFFNKTEKTIIYSAHEFKTAVEIFSRLEALIMSSAALRRQVKRVKRGNDDRSIILRDGSRVKFLARSGGSARGFSGDLIIFDEAYALKGSMLAAMRPTMAARSITGQPQIWFASSAGMEDSDVLNGMRSRVIDEPSQEPHDHTILQTAAEPKLLWMEWSAHPDCASDDLEGRRRSNPALGKRISLEFLDDELRSFASDPEKGEEYYRREYLGIRPQVMAAHALSVQKLRDSVDSAAELPEKIALSVDVTPQRDYAVIAAAGVMADGRIVTEVVDHGIGTEWLPDAVKRLKDSLGPTRIIVDASSAAGALEPEFRRKGVKVTSITAKQYAQACATFLDDFEAGRIVTRLEQEELVEAVRDAQMKWLGDSLFRWNRKTPLANIAPLVAVTLAIRGVEAQRNKLAREEGIGGRKKNPRRLAVGN